ncbi:unnamed protein product [Nesidiocoris tenuis]|uniref:Uncharacterized protein n=1 Tax=Nesidiocoris tenuis TaxID=355587 RepID=A0A6H5HGW5_9HEMI|nr:unnamed protein product [Nesidiocoris tenuis]
MFVGNIMRRNIRKVWRGDPPPWVRAWHFVRHRLAVLSSSISESDAFAGIFLKIDPPLFTKVLKEGTVPTINGPTSVSSHDKSENVISTPEFIFYKYPRYSQLSCQARVFRVQLSGNRST